MIKISRVELHTPIFVGGHNLGAKLDAGRRKDLDMQYDGKGQLLFVTFNGETAMVPVPAIASMVAETFKRETPSVLKAAKPVVDAQVSSPTGHVFAGPGKGQR